MATGKLHYAGFARPSLGFFDDLENVEIKVKVFGLSDGVQFIVVIVMSGVIPVSCWIFFEE